MRNWTVDFSGITSDDLNLIFTEVDFGDPEPKTSYVSVPNRSGDLDLTDYYGTVTYENREHKLSFQIPTRYDHAAVYSEVLNQLNGQKKRITFSSDEDYYYSGRLTVGSLSHNGARWAFNVTANCDPYKYKQESTMVSLEATSAGTTVTLTNDYMPCLLSVTCDAEITVELPDDSIALSAGQHTIAYNLPAGETTVTVKCIDGNACNVGIKYQEGRL